MELKRHISLLISVPFYFIIIATCLGGEEAWAIPSSVVEEVYATANISEAELSNNIYLYKDDLGISATMIDLPTSPLTTLCTSNSKPYIDENIIAWNAVQGQDHNPSFIKIGENKTYTVSDSIGNVDIKTSNGILVYKNKNGYLCITNISDKAKFGLSPGKSHKINNVTVGLFAIKGDKIVFLDAGNKNIYLISGKDTVDNFKTIITRGSWVSRLQLTVHDGETLMLWQEGTKLYYCNLDTRDGNNNYIVNQLSSQECLPNEVSAHGDQVIYFAKLDEKPASEKAVFIQTLEEGSKPTPLSDIKGNVYCLYGGAIYYVKEANICRYNLAKAEDEILFNFRNAGIDSSPTRIASNGKDIVFNNQKAAYWLAGISDLEILGVKQVMLKGEKVPIKGRATYSNNFSEDVNKDGEWTSSNPSVAKIESDELIAVSAGDSTISWEYKGGKTSFELTVKEKLGLELAHDHLEIELDENIKIQAYLKYSDGSHEDISEEATWQSQINEIKDGIYYAHNPGVDIIMVSYQGFTTSLGIIINPPPVPEPAPNYKRSSPSRKAEVLDKEILTLQIQNLPIIKYIFDYNKLMRLFSPYDFLGEIIEDYQKGTLFARFKHMPEPHVMGIEERLQESKSNIL